MLSTSATALQDPGRCALWTTTWMGTLFGTMLFPLAACRSLGKLDVKWRAEPLRAPRGARELGWPHGCFPQTCTLPRCPRPHPYPSQPPRNTQIFLAEGEMLGRSLQEGMADGTSWGRDMGHKDPSFPQSLRDGGMANEAHWQPRKAFGLAFGFGSSASRWGAHAEPCGRCSPSPTCLQGSRAELSTWPHVPGPGSGYISKMLSSAAAAWLAG